MKEPGSPDEPVEGLSWFQPKTTTLRGEVLAFLIFAVPSAILVGIVEGASAGIVVSLLGLSFILSATCGAIVHWRRKRGLPTV
jgi:hypothetical protein